MPDSAPRFREYPIHPALAPFVKCIWSLESDQPIHDAPRERILPDSCVELVFHFADPFRSHFSNGESALQPRSFLVGQMKRFLEIEPAGRMGLIAVRFHARGAYRFLPQPLSAIANEIVDLREIWKQCADEWTERIALARGIEERVRIIVEVLIESLHRNGQQDCVVDRCLHLIETQGGQLSVAELASAIGVSNRQLTRRFENGVGVSPKEFSRVKRFLRSLRHLKSRKQRTLTETALECGYFDQAHFNHEFRQFAGMTPGEFSDYPNVVF
jgi:AraC-like DNA-binding protein